MDEAQLTNLVGLTPGQGQSPGEAPLGLARRDGKAAEQAGTNERAPEEAVMSGTEGLPALSPLQERAMVALLTCPTVAEASRQSKVGERTIRNWLAHDRDFIDQFRSGRREVSGRAVHRLQNEVESAVATISELHRCKDNPPMTRLAAARTVLEFAFRGTEMLDAAEQLRTTQEAVEAAERREKKGRRG